MRACLVLACCLWPLTAAASPVIFGSSWDGSPPGTVADLFGVGGWTSGLTFPSGAYVFLVLGGVTSDTTDTLEIESTAAGWSVTGTSRDLPGGARSDGPQWAWHQVTPNFWVWGWEDLTLSISDRDYQDRFGTLTLVGDVTPQCINCAPVPVPEPATAWLVLVGLGWRCKARCQARGVR